MRGEQAGGVIGREVSVIEAPGECSAPAKSLCVSEVGSVGILRNHGDGAEDADRLGLVFIELKSTGERGIEAGDVAVLSDRLYHGVVVGI